MIYTVTFNPAIDYVLHLTAPLAVGEINRTSDEACQFGGKGINVSGVLRELGCESIALGFTAGETGAWLERGLQLSGLKTRFIRLPDGMTRINVKVKGAKETEINGSGPNITPEAMQACGTIWKNWARVTFWYLPAAFLPACRRMFTSRFWLGWMAAASALWWMPPVICW